MHWHLEFVRDFNNEGVAAFGDAAHEFGLASDSTGLGLQRGEGCPQRRTYGGFDKSGAMTGESNEVTGLQHGPCIGASGRRSDKNDPGRNGGSRRACVPSNYTSR